MAVETSQCEDLLALLCTTATTPCSVRLPRFIIYETYHPFLWIASYTLCVNDRPAAQTLPMSRVHIGQHLPSTLAQLALLLVQDDDGH